MMTQAGGIRVVNVDIADCRRLFELGFGTSDVNTTIDHCPITAEIEEADLSLSNITVALPPMPSGTTSPFTDGE
jgi:hypothetical protein